MTPPVSYFPDLLDSYTAASCFLFLSDSLDWERKDGVPRSEYHVSDSGEPYTYGDKFPKTYESRPWAPSIQMIRTKLRETLGVDFDICHLNMYHGNLTPGGSATGKPSDYLGWHADDSPEISQDHPIATVSLGAAREIQFKPPGKSNTEAGSILLEPGSVAVMAAGMQRNWVHRIPKTLVATGTRISLTFRVRAS